MLRDDDKALQQGTIIYEVTHGYVNDPTSSLSSELYYAANGSYRQRIGSRQGTDIREHIFDGSTDMLVVEKEDNSGEVQFSSAGHINVNRDFAVSLVPAPCPAFGRGLSTLSNITITVDSEKTRLTGTAADGSLIEALLDQDHGYVAKEIHRKNEKGKTIGRWQLSAPKRFGSAPFIATDSTLIGYRSSSAKPVFNGHWIIQQANFTAPEPKLLNYDWHKPGLTIYDFRLGTDQSIYSSDKLPSDITSSQLFEMTKKNAEGNAKIQQQAKQIEKANKRILMTRRIIPMLLSICVVGAIVVGFVLRRRQRIIKK